jgi:hypothetical protein
MGEKPFSMLFGIDASRLSPIQIGVKVSVSSGVVGGDENVQDTVVVEIRYGDGVACMTGQLGASSFVKAVGSSPKNADARILLPILRFVHKSAYD